jgi:hypothetical protein
MDEDNYIVSLGVGVVSGISLTIRILIGVEPTKKGITEHLVMKYCENILTSSENIIWQTPCIVETISMIIALVLFFIGLIVILSSSSDRLLKFIILLFGMLIGGALVINSII